MNRNERPNLAIISTSEHCQYLQTMDFSSLESDISFISYQNWQELPDIFLSLQGSFDGFCTTGIFPKEVIIRAMGDEIRPVQAIMVRSVEFYKVFFQLLNSDRNIDFSKVFLDFSLIDRREPMSVKDYIEGHFIVEHERSDIFAGISTEQLISYDKQIVQKAKRLIADSKADLIISRFSSVASFLRQEKIHHTFVYPDPDNVMDTLNLLIKDIKLRRMLDALPAVIFISSAALGSQDSGDISTASTDLQHALLEFDKLNMTGFLIQRTNRGFEIFTTRHTVRRITSDFTTCQLYKYIYSCYGIQVQLGYGIGSDIVLARANAYSAQKSSLHHGQSYLLSENGDLIGPLEGEGALKVEGRSSPDAKLCAQEAGLSVSTIQRILSVTELLGTKDITNQELATALHVTMANANRFLIALEKSGWADITSTRKSCTKGRPSRIYHIKF